MRPAVRYAVAGVVRRRKRWHSRGESANAEASTRTRVECQTAGSTSGAARMRRRGPRRLPLAADRRRARPLLARAAEPYADDAGDAGCATAGRAAAHDAGADRVAARADPGRAARAGRSRSSATGRAGCTSPPTASSRPPGCGSPTHRAARVALAAAARRVLDLGCGIGGDLVAFARAGLTVAGVDLDPVRVAMAEDEPRGRSTCRGRSWLRTRRRLTSPLRRRLRRPCAEDRARPGLRRRRLLAAVVLRRVAAHPPGRR